MSYSKTNLKRLKRYIKEINAPRFFRDIVWPDKLNKQGSSLSMSEGAMLVELINDHELEQVVHFPTRGQNTLDLIIVDIHCPDRLSDHGIVSGTLKIVIPPTTPRNLRERCINIRKVIMNL